MIKVYIASPYTIPEGHQLENTNKSFDAAIQLIELGYAPYAPLYSHFLHERKPQPYEVWMKLDYEWIQRCDCLLRMGGESFGADSEVNFAIFCNIPIYYSVEELIKRMPA